MVIIQDVQDYFSIQHGQSGQNRQNRVFPVFDGKNAKSRSVSDTASGGNSNLTRLLACFMTYLQFPVNYATMRAARLSC